MVNIIIRLKLMKNTESNRSTEDIKIALVTKTENRIFKEVLYNLF